MVKTHLLRPGSGHCKQVKIFNRVVSWHGRRGITDEAEPRHAELAIEQLGMKGAKRATTPGTREDGRTKEEHQEILSEKEATMYRAAIARCNNFALGRPNAACAVNGLARDIARPTNGDLQRLKRLGRYIEGKPRLQQWYE